MDQKNSGVKNIPFKSNKKIILTDYLVKSNLVYRYYRSWPLIKVGCHVYASLVTLSSLVLLLVSLYHLITRLIRSTTILDETNNRIFFVILGVIGDLSILYDFINYDPITFCEKFDQIWSVLPFSSDAYVQNKFTQLRKINRIFLIVFALSQFNMIIVLSTDAPDSDIIWIKALLKVRKYFYMVNAFYYVTVIDHLGLTSSLICSAFASIDQQFCFIGQRKIFKQRDDITIEQLLYYRNVYEKLGLLIKLLGDQHAIFVSFFYLLVIPKLVTLVYDIIFTNSSFLYYYLSEFIFSMTRLITISQAIGGIPGYSAKPWKNLYNAVMTTKNSSIIIEINLFLDRIYHQDFGVKIFGTTTITPAITPTLITLVITYFIAITSFNQGSIIKQPAFNSTDIV